MPLEPGKHIGQVVEVKFLDHVTSGDMGQELVFCTIWGRLISDDWQKIIVRRWETDEDVDASINMKYATLIRSAVVSIRPLTYEEK